MNSVSNHVLLALTIAMSIDVLVVELGFTLLKINIMTLNIVTGLIILILSFLVAHLRNNFTSLKNIRIELSGDIILIGLKINNCFFTSYSKKRR